MFTRAAPRPPLQAAMVLSFAQITVIPFDFLALAINPEADDTKSLMLVRAPLPLEHFSACTTRVLRAAFLTQVRMIRLLRLIKLARLARASRMISRCVHARACVPVPMSANSLTPPGLYASLSRRRHVHSTPLVWLHVLRRGQL